MAWCLAVMMTTKQALPTWFSTRPQFSTAASYNSRMRSTVTGHPHSLRTRRTGTCKGQIKQAAIINI